MKVVMVMKVVPLLLAPSFLAVLLVGCSTAPSQNAGEPALDFDHTSWENLAGPGFDDLHSPFNGSANESLIFGNLSTTMAASSVEAAFRPFLGRWEGFDYGYPVPKDMKVVLFVQEIANGEGTGFVWSGTNLQNPSDIRRVHFRVGMKPGRGAGAAAEPVLYWRATWPFAWGDFSFRIDPVSNQLTATLEDHALGYHRTGDVILTRDRTFTVYRDYSILACGKRHSCAAIRKRRADALRRRLPGIPAAGI